MPVSYQNSGDHYNTLQQVALACSRDDESESEEVKTDTWADMSFI